MNDLLFHSDVIIIGAGPAGSASAITCARAGLKTTLVCREPQAAEQKGQPSPLESIHPGVSTLLTQIQAQDAVTNATVAYYDGIQAGTEYSELGADKSGKWQGSHICRQQFNVSLKACAAAQGVEVVSNENVLDLHFKNGRACRITTSKGKTIHARYIIDCSGRKRFGGKRMRFKEKFYSPPLTAWTGISEGIDPIEYSKLKTIFIPSGAGWSWLAPGAQWQCAWTRLSRSGKIELSPPDELKRYPLLGSTQITNVRWRLFRPVVSEGILLAGDAAGILDPAAGQGVFNALLSGINAAHTVIRCLHEPQYEAWYLAEYDGWFIEQYEQKAQRLKEYYHLHGINLFNNSYAY